MHRLFWLWAACQSSMLFADVPPNDEKLIESLIEQGVICDGLSYEQQQKALSLYLQQKFSKKNINTPSNDTPSSINDENTNKNSALKQHCINPDTE
ncbi:hypothetical protein KSS82_01970 [Vibrio mimicus]|nr:hypothetical protein [Vibrio mimicus]QXC56033.1 hypothetical protein KSS82_01970 [Vibrio mimicus]